MADILSNSLKKQTTKEIPEKISPAVKLAQKEDSTATKIVKAFVAVDPKTVCKTVVEQVVIPTIKKTLITSVTSGLSMMFNINVTPQIVDSVFGTQTTGSRIGYTPYSTLNGTIQPQPQLQTPQLQHRPMSGLDRYPLFSYASEADARTVIEQMDELADRYDKSIAVGYLCQLVGQPDTPADYNFGWSRDRIAQARPIMNIDGTWAISWPKPIPINV